MAALLSAFSFLLLLGGTSCFVGESRQGGARLVGPLRLRATVRVDVSPVGAGSHADDKAIGSDRTTHFVECLSLTQWGVFREATLVLGAAPSFTVISGESGAGKSVLISAIEYLSGSSTFKGRRPLHRTTAVSDSVITLRTGGAVFRRSYSPLSKRAFSEADGIKVPMKHVSDALYRSVRVWSSNSLQLLDNGNAGVISYVDRTLPLQDRVLVEKVGAIHSDWSLSYDNMQRLLALEKRMNTGSEVELLSHFSSEIALFETKLRKLLLEVLQITEDLAVTFSGAPEEEEEEEGGATPAKSPLSVAELLAGMYSLRGLGLGGHGKKIKEEAAAPLDLAAAWRMLQCADKLYSGLAKAFSLEGGGKAGSPGRVIEKAIKDLEDAFDALSDTQIYIKKIGFDETSINSQLEKAQVDIQGAAKLLRAGGKTLGALEEGLPSLEPLLGRLHALKSDWEGLARKHDVAPPEVQKLRVQWADDLASMQNIVSELLAARSEEETLRENYFRAARALTASRRASAERLSAQLNALFPSLEMANKKVRIDVVVGAAVEEAARAADAGRARASDALRPGGDCSVNGWDAVFMTVYPDAAATTAAEQQDILSPSSALTLSSGEAARLSLALETCVLTRDEDDTRLIIFDEVDAHVGGETAAVIARLLLSLGQRRQVVAVSHNPIFAAAADRHFVVSREPAAKGGGSEFGSSDSRVQEVTGSEREMEIMRMAGPLLSIISNFRTRSDRDV